MSMSGDFLPPDADFNNEPNYPSAFGITFTPIISGICLGVLGIGLAAFGWMTFVEPLRLETEVLDAKVKQKESQLGDSQKIEANLKKARIDLAEVQKQRQQVLSLFAQQKNMATLLFDLNQLIKRNNSGLLDRKVAKLASCPDWVKEQFTTTPDGQRFEETIGPLSVEAKLRRYKPVVPAAGTATATATTVPNVVTDGSLGLELNNKLKRDTVEVEVEGNFNQIQQIFRAIERLQPLLVLRDMNITVDRQGGSPILYEINSNSPVPEALRNCQPDTVLKTSFKMDALIPVSPEEAKLLVPVPTASPSPGATPSPSTPPKK